MSENDTMKNWGELQAKLDDYVRQGEELLRLCRDSGWSAKFATSNHCQMKYYLTSAHDGFSDLFRKPDDARGALFSVIPEAAMAYANTLKARLESRGTDGIEVFVNLAKDIEACVHEGCTEIVYRKNDKRTYRMYELLVTNYEALSVWMHVMGYSFTGYQDDNPRYRISWDMEENE